MAPAFFLQLGLLVEEIIGLVEKIDVEKHCNLGVKMDDLDEQLILLEKELKNCAIVGDHIAMAIVLSHYGCNLIYLADRHQLTTVHHQILRVNSPFFP